MVRQQGGTTLKVKIERGEIVVPNMQVRIVKTILFKKSKNKKSKTLINLHDLRYKIRFEGADIIYDMSKARSVSLIPCYPIRQPAF